MMFLRYAWIAFIAFVFQVMSGVGAAFQQSALVMKFMYTRQCAIVDDMYNLNRPESDPIETSNHDLN